MTGIPGVGSNCSSTIEEMFSQASHKQHQSGGERKRRGSDAAGHHQPFVRCFEQLPLVGFTERVPGKGRAVYGVPRWIQSLGLAAPGPKTLGRSSIATFTAKKTFPRTNTLQDSGESTY
jgi:hypothetical protein